MGKNEIIIKRNNRSIKIPSWVEYGDNLWRYAICDHVIMCLWKGCTELREKIFEINLKDYQIVGENEKIYLLSIENLKHILQILENYNKKNWGTANFWGWYEIRRTIYRDRRVIKWAIKQKQKHGDALDFYFYDKF